MFPIRKILTILALTALLLLTVVAPVSAFDGRSGDQVIIEQGETINDDLYVTAQELILEGTVNGDVFAAGQIMTVNGRIDGDLIAVGQSVIVHGEVTGAIRAAGSTILIGETATVGGDVVAAGYSLEAQAGSTIGQDVVFGGGQILLAGDVERNVLVGTSAFELSGTVGGDVRADVEESQTGGPPPFFFMPQSPVNIPRVDPGIAIEPSAQITGDLEYTHADELAIPAGVVGGEVTRLSARSSTSDARQQTTGERIAEWALDSVRSGVTLLLIGLVLVWLFPALVAGLSNALQARPLPSLGWGLVTWAAFFLIALLIVIVTVLGGVLFGVLTLGQLTGTVIVVGLLTLFVLIAGFVLFTTFVAKVIFGAAVGRWLLGRTGSSLATHRYWPMVLGILITVGVIALLSFPLIPGFLGGLLNFVIVLFGLGALWVWVRQRQQTTILT